MTPQSTDDSQTNILQLVEKLSNQLSTQEARLERQETRLREQEREIATLRAVRPELPYSRGEENSGQPPISEKGPQKGTSRRRMLKKLAGAAALAAAATAGASLSGSDTAQATTGDVLTVGSVRSGPGSSGGVPSPTVHTGIKSFIDSGLTDSYFLSNVLFEARNIGTVSGGADPTPAYQIGYSIALAGTSYGNDANTITTQPNKVGVYGGADTYGVLGVGGSTGVYGNGYYGMQGTGTIGGAFSGAVAPLIMGKSTNTAAVGAPSSGTHQTGEMFVDYNGKLFYCTQGSTPGIWGQIAPVVFLSSPLRVVGAPNSTYAPGTFASLADGSVRYFKMEGSWTDNNPSGPYTAVIPAQATALLATVSTINTTTSGYLTVYPANAAQPVVATMGFGPGFVTSNSITVKLGPIPSGPDAGKQGVAVFTYSNGANVNLAFDVVGYFL